MVSVFFLKKNKNNCGSKRFLKKNKNNCGSKRFLKVVQNRLWFQNVTGVINVVNLDFFLIRF